MEDKGGVRGEEERKKAERNGEGCDDGEQEKKRERKEKGKKRDENTNKIKKKVIRNDSVYF